MPNLLGTYARSRVRVNQGGALRFRARKERCEIVRCELRLRADLRDGFVACHGASQSIGPASGSGMLFRRATPALMQYEPRARADSGVPASARAYDMPLSVASWRTAAWSVDDMPPHARTLASGKHA